MTPPRIQPIGDHILLQYQENKTEETQGGLIIPDSARERPQEATVVALGRGRPDKDGKLTPFEVKVGDTVLVGKYGGAEVKWDDQKYTFVRENDILAVLT
jgi:chaperonin GroES